MVGGEWIRIEKMYCGSESEVKSGNAKCEMRNAAILRTFSFSFLGRNFLCMV